MTLDRLEVIEAVEVAAKATTSKGTLAVLGAVKFDGQRVSGYNLDYYASAPLVTDFQTAVGVKPFLQYLKSLTSTQVDIEVIEGNITVGFGDTKATFPTFDVADVPSFEINPDTDRPIPFDSDRFRTIVAVCTPYVSLDQTRMVLNGIHVSRDDDGIVYACATDGRRLIRVPIGEVAEGFDAIIPIEYLRLIAKESITHINVNDTSIGFTCKSGNFYAGKLINAVYPNATQVIPPDNGMRKVVLPEDIVTRLKRLEVAGKGVSVTLDITPEMCTITTQTGGIKLEDTFEVSSEITDTLIFNVSYLIGVVSASNILLIKDSSSPMVVNYMGGKIVLMPMRN